MGARTGRLASPFTAREVYLKGLGLDDDSDAKHLMYAVTNGCDRFVTLDPHFFSRIAALEARCPSIRIVRPSELAAELRAPVTGP